MRAAVYARKSTDHQSESTIEEQIRRCTHYIEAQGWELSEIYDDTGTGMNTDRPGFSKMMEEIEDWDVTVAYKLDRFHRDSRNSQDWAIELNGMSKNFVAIDISVDTTTAMGMGIFKVITALNEMEVALTRERTRMGLSGVKAQGRWVGKPPYGYDSVFKLTEEQSDKGILVINEAEAEVVRMIFEMRASQVEVIKKKKKVMVDTPYSHIAEVLIEAGTLTKSGRRNWSSSTVLSIINNRNFYSGIYYNRDNEKCNYEWEAILNINGSEK